MEKYLKRPWHKSSEELPSYGGAPCMCYNTFCNCEMRMIFHRAREGRDYFTAEGRFYDWDWISYWCYMSDYEK